MKRKILLITCLGATLRFWGVLKIPVNFEEAHNILLTRAASIELMIKAAKTYPPLYFLIMRALGLFSQELVYLRLFSMFMGIITIPIIYLIGKKLFNEKVGLISAFLVSISPSLIFYSSTARMYSLAILEMALVTYFFMKFTKNGSNTFFLGITILLGLYTHYFFLVLLATINIYFFIFLRKMDLFRKWIIINILVAILSLPIINLLLKFFNEPINLPVFFTPIKLLLFLITPFLPWDIIQNINELNINTFIFAALLGIFSLGILGLTIISFKKKLYLLLLIFLIPSLVIIPFVSRLFYGIAAVRSFTIFSPIYFFIIGSYLEKVKKIPRYLFIGLLCLSSLGFCLSVVLNNFYPINLPQLFWKFGENDVVVYNDITSYLPAKIVKPKGKHFLIYPGYLDTTALVALNVEVTPLSNIPKSLRIWYVKQDTDWKPFESKAEELEKFLASRFDGKKISVYYNTHLILYESEDTK